MWLLDVLVGLFDGRALVAGVFQRPGDVGGDAEDVGVVAVGGAFVDEVGVGLPTAVGLLLARRATAACAAMRRGSTS